MKYYIGIDLGGTNIKAGVVNEEFEIIAKASTKTLCPRPAKDICDDMAKVSIEACKLAGISVDDVEWIGVGTPGIADNINGTIPYSNNLDFHDVPVRKYIQAHINKPVYVANDANAAAYDWIYTELMEFEGKLPPVSEESDLDLQEGDVVRNISVNIRFQDGWDE